MRLRWRILVTAAVLLAAAASGWLWSRREDLARRWELLRVAASSNFGEARQRLARFDGGPDRRDKLRALAASWGTGRPWFDFYVARYVALPDSSADLREVFSLHLASRGGLLDRWAHYWAWQTADPNARIAAQLGVLDVLVEAQSTKSLTWREVLDLQAALSLAGDPQAAERLTPENWRSRYEPWRRRHPGLLRDVKKPDRPFPDWQGAVPAAAE